MIILEVDNIRKHFGPDPVLDGVTFEVRPGDRIGLVGPNGCGKTTLMKILAGREDADGGSYRLHESAHCGYLEQQAQFDPEQTVLAEARHAMAGLIGLEQEALTIADELSKTTDDEEHRRLALRYDHLQHELHSKDAYNIDYKIERVLDGLRFTRASFDQTVASLSGGEQNRLLLAKLLLAEPNLMILDEPSNHLDIEATEWLEDFLIESSAAILLVSHDRYFLDKVTNRTLELYHGTVESYVGNFSAYRTQKAERLLVQQRTYEKQQIEIEKTKDFIRRNHYGQKSTQAEDRRKKLERMEEELVAPPRTIATPPMKFGEASRSGDIVLRAEHISKSFDRPLFNDVSLEVIRSERWALLGPNGCGKSTLLKCLLGEVEPDAGNVTFGAGVDIGYFDQQLSSLDDDKSVADAIRPPKKLTVEQQRRDLLACFGITGDTAMQKVSSLSGGERCRAALARLALDDANLLVLDEPTNHLDLWARDSLEQAIKNFEGTVVFVSHDRYFVNQVADHLLIVEPTGVRVIEGNYETYLMLSGKRGAAADETKNDGKSGKTGKTAKKLEKASAKQAKQDNQQENAASKPQKKRRFAFRKVADIENEILDREMHLGELHEQLTRPEVLRNGDRVREIKAEIDQEQETVKTLYDHWDEAVEMNW